MIRKKWWADMPHLLWEFDRTKNEKNPEAYSVNASVWWMCRYGHSYKMPIRNKLNGLGCPLDYCLVGPWGRDFEAFRSYYPDLATEYLSAGNSAEKYVPLLGHYIVAWRCSNGHIWRSSIRNRINGQKCPVCNANE